MIVVGLDPGWVGAAVAVRAMPDETVAILAVSKWKAKPDKPHALLASARNLVTMLAESYTNEDIRLAVERIDFGSRMAIASLNRCVGVWMASMPPVEPLYIRPCEWRHAVGVSMRGTAKPRELKSRAMALVMQMQNASVLHADGHVLDTTDVCEATLIGLWGLQELKRQEEGKGNRGKRGHVKT